jgi:hypothetical protein
MREMLKKKEDGYLGIPNALLVLVYVLKMINQMDIQMHI